MSKEEQEARVELVLTLPDRIQAIHDGSRGGPATEMFGSSSNKHIKFDSGDCICCRIFLHRALLSSSYNFLLFLMSDGKMDDGFFEESEESSQFRQEYEMRKKKQACSLSTLSCCYIGK